MKLQYFAWIKERLGRQEETIDRGDITLSGLLDHLCNKGGSHEYVFSKPEKFCISVNNQLINADLDPSYIIHQNDEVAFFPPISGG